MKYFRYHNTNCFFIENSKGKYLAFDAGWPCSIYEYQRMLKSIDVKYIDIQKIVISHMHMDHAGLLSEFIEDKKACLLTHNQVAEIDNMEKIITKNKEYSNYYKIDKSKIIELTIHEINQILINDGFDITIIETKGHSFDSISLITKENEALIGDLSPINQVMDNDIESINSWNILISNGIKAVYPSHADVFEI